ncbi:unnamed protein product [Triticum turgidum subsp. durum]|uniref:holo-[acyl-carrier-protein] synthase n=1 Tax=Triticum turgidum subsp. durum TaxID=4567 RepID=A0A9R0UUC5_TRITD|nr:unnamed protein product [Triticum turgidum subsp. durum]
MRHHHLLRCRAMPILPSPPRTLRVSGSLVHHRLIRCRGLPIPPRTPGVSGGRLFSSLPLPPPLQSPREVHVWYLCPDELNNQSQLNMYEELLSPSERKYADSMKATLLRKDVVLSRALLRTTLSRYTDCKIDPRSFEFKKNKFGKPEVLWPLDDSTAEQPLHFNISHTTSLIACGIAINAHIGIDVEEKKRNTTKNILSLARRYFTPSEVDSLAEISDSDAQRKEFLKLWTLKEAYVKALGMGFSGAPFSTFSIMLETSKGIRISKTSNTSRPGCDHLSENWLFTLAELNSSHYMSVCIEDSSRSQAGPEDSPASVGLKVWKTVPFVEDTLVSGTEAVKLIA